jgi:hypothetical protein
MSTLPTRIEREAGRRLAASEIVDITAARERALSRMLMLCENYHLALLYAKA